MESTGSKGKVRLAAYVDAEFAEQIERAAQRNQSTVSSFLGMLLTTGWRTTRAGYRITDAERSIIEENQ